MKPRVGWMIVMGLSIMASPAVAWAHQGMMGEDQETAAENTGKEQTLTGEVVDVFCYLSHGADGLGKAHASCARKCIRSGLPVALKVGHQLYLAAMNNHDPANATLAEFAGEQVTVRGQVLEQDGQHVIAISRVEKAQ